MTSDTANINGQAYLFLLTAAPQLLLFQLRVMLRHVLIVAVLIL